MIITKGFISNTIITKGFGTVGAVIIAVTKKFFFSSYVKVRAIFNSIVNNKNIIFSTSKDALKQFEFDTFVVKRIIVNAQVKEKIYLNAMIMEV